MFEWWHECSDPPLPRLTELSCPQPLSFCTSLQPQQTVVAAASVAMVAACRAVVEERRVQDLLSQERKQRLASGLVKAAVKGEAEVRE